MEGIILPVLFVALVYMPNAYSSKCCFPDQYEGQEGISAGQVTGNVGTAITDNFKFSVDAKKQLVAASGFSVVNRETKYKIQVLYNYGQGKSYTVVNGNCSVESLTTKLFTCIPDEAKQVMDTYYGINPKLKVVGYEFNIQGLSSILIVTKDGQMCAPVAQHIEGTNMISNAGFMGLTEGIKNPSVFDVPTACHKEARQTNLLFEMDHMKYVRQVFHGSFVGRLLNH